MFRRAHIFPAVFLLLSACQHPTTYGPHITPEELHAEEATQQQLSDSVKAQGGTPKPWRNHPNMRLQFERVGDRVEKAGAQLCVAIHEQGHGCYYYFELSRESEVNAHADGKTIVVNTGMMRFVQSDDELGVVMGHEFAHNLMQHPKSQGENATVGMLLGAAADALATSQGINTKGGMAGMGGDIAQLGYSIAFEEEADYIGLYVAARAGYDITKAPNIWRRMSIENPDEIYSSVTHPSNAERFVMMQKTIQEIQYKQRHKIPLTPDFKSAS